VHVLFTSLASPALVLAKVVIKRTAHSLLYGRWGPRNQIAQLFIATQKPSQIDLMKGGSPTADATDANALLPMRAPREQTNASPRRQPRNLSTSPAREKLDAHKLISQIKHQLVFQRAAKSFDF
jgi:hypothetical protein